MDLYNAFLDNEKRKAEELQKRIVPVNTAVTRQWGVPALKAAMDHLGYYGGPARRPLLPLQDDIKSQLIDLLENFNP
jgi:4-hydroxy-2-oxoglutarate aldolase